MSDRWLLTMKPSFQSEWLALPPKESKQILEKLQLLCGDPHPDAKVKKKLKGFSGKLHRLRSGDYRIFYTFEKPYVSLLALRKRDDQTYEVGIEAELLGGGEVSLEAAKQRTDAYVQRVFQPAGNRTPLPEPITAELLNRLRIDARYHARLTALESQEDLLNCPGVPDDLLLQLDEVLFEKPLEEVAAQPEVVADPVEDLLRFKEGDLPGFLLRLNPTQEKFVTWGLNAKGPTLVKGGPGTGKSTVALYRVKTLVEALKKEAASPRILFTTYTNALVQYSQQLLASLLGDDRELVDVRTADSVALQLARKRIGSVAFANHQEQRDLFRRALDSVEFDGNALEKAAQRQTVDRLPESYLLEELTTVIQARQIVSLDAYLAAGRPGRKVGLNKIQRRAVWCLHQAFERQLADAGRYTWQQLRGVAAAVAEEDDSVAKYDGVLIDEAQDLDPAALRMLVHRCVAPNRLFLTADANQSIYGAGFRWNDVHGWLQFRGRTGLLEVNHRSTREIGEAAQDYLGKGKLDGDDVTRRYVNNGPLPVVRRVKTAKQEAELLSRFLRGASREFRLGLRSCAVFCPTEKIASRVVEALAQLDVPATYMTGKTLDLEQRGVKVLTLKSSKGLEFPIVALAGFVHGDYPPVRDWMNDGQIEELLTRERRTMFVGMTRPMRALLVTVDGAADSPLYEGFGDEHWNVR